MWTTTRARMLAVCPIEARTNKQGRIAAIWLSWHEDRGVWARGAILFQQDEGGGREYRSGLVDSEGAKRVEERR